jgi:preprotein translocase subunit SecD
MKTRRHVVSILAVLFATALSLVGVLVLNARPKLGLDLQGGLSVVLTARGEVEEGVLDQTVDIIRNRVDSLGAQEPDISSSGEENIIVQLPGIRDPERALEVIGQTAQLRFREVLDASPADDKKDLKKKGWKLTEEDPVDKEVIFPSSDDKLWYRLGPAEVVGSDIDSAQASFDQVRGQWTVNLGMTRDGRKKWGDVTTRLAGGQKQLAIILDQRVESAPVVQDPITNGEAQISGQFTEPEAKDLALVLRTGALPIELEQSQVQRVSATLGTASLRAGLIAGAIGLAVVAVYMFAFYRWLGVINLIGLAIFNTLILGVIGLISTYRGFTLTLAGIAGMIVSLGVAADTYIIYFERLKEEVRDGKSFRSAVHSAYRSAMRTNIAANTVAGGASVILYLFAVGPVRGFALTLGISVVLDILLLYFFTHPALVLISGSGRLTSRRAMGGSAPESVAVVRP